MVAGKGIPISSGTNETFPTTNTVRASNRAMPMALEAAYLGVKNDENVPACIKQFVTIASSIMSQMMPDNDGGQIKVACEKNPKDPSGDKTSCFLNFNPARQTLTAQKIPETKSPGVTKALPSTDVKVKTATKVLKVSEEFKASSPKRKYNQVGHQIINAAAGKKFTSVTTNKDSSTVDRSKFPNHVPVSKVQTSHNAGLIEKMGATTTMPSIHQEENRGTEGGMSSEGTFPMEQPEKEINESEVEYCKQKHCDASKNATAKGGQTAIAIADFCILKVSAKGDNHVALEDANPKNPACLETFYKGNFPQPACPEKKASHCTCNHVRVPAKKGNARMW